MDFMSVAQTGLSLQAARTQSQLSVAVLRTSLDAQKQQAAQVLVLLESSQLPAPPPPGNTGSLINTIA